MKSKNLFGKSWWNRKSEKKEKTVDVMVKTCKECGQKQIFAPTSIVKENEHLKIRNVSGTPLLTFNQ